MAPPPISDNCGHSAPITKAICQKPAEMIPKKSHAASLRMPQAVRARPSSRYVRRPSFVGGRRTFNRAVPYSAEWNQYLREEVHNNCDCYKAEDKEAKVMPDLDFEHKIDKILHLRNNTKQLFMRYRSRLNEIDAKIQLLTEKRDSALCDSKSRSKFEEDIKFEQKKRNSTIRDYEMMEGENRTEAKRKLEAWFDMGRINQSHWPYVSFEERTKKREDAARLHEEDILSGAIRSYALLIRRLYNDNAILTENTEDSRSFRTERYSVSLTIPVLEFATAHRAEITAYLSAYDVKEQEQEIENKVKRLLLCESMGIDPELAAKYSKHMDCIIRCEPKQYDTREEHPTLQNKPWKDPGPSLKEALLAAIERDKNPSAEYEVWRAGTTDDTMKNTISDEVHAQVWEEFRSPIRKWKRSLHEGLQSDSRFNGQTIGTVEGFEKWKREKNVKLKARNEVKSNIGKPPSVDEEVIEGNMSDAELKVHNEVKRNIGKEPSVSKETAEEDHVPEENEVGRENRFSRNSRRRRSYESTES